MSAGLAAGAVDRDVTRITPSGLYLREGLAFQAWVGVGRRISEITNASSWWLGDWIVYGQHAYGRRYTLALEATSLDYQTLRNYAWVARRFEPSRRRVALSLQHHAEVAPLPEPDQDLWLRRAERFGWSRNQLRKRLAQERRPQAADGGDHEVMCRIKVTAGRQQRWQEAAGRCDQDLSDWMIWAADTAAEQILLPRSGQAPG